MKIIKMVALVCMLFVFIINLNCTNSFKPDPIDTSNNIWLVSISPEQNKKLTYKDTLRVKIGYCFDPATINTDDTVFSFHMLFKKNNATSGNSLLDYVSASCCSNNASKWSDTLLLEYPVAEIIRLKPQLKPLTFSFQMITGSNCKNGGNEICMILQNAHQYYLYKEGIVDP